MAPHALNIPTGPHKTQNSVVIKPPYPSFATEAVATTCSNNYGLLKCAYKRNNNQGTGMDQACLGTLQLLCHHTKDKDVDMLGLLSTKHKANADPDGKPKIKKVKVFPAFANHTPGSDAVLALLSQVDATLEATQLAEDRAAMPHSELQKHHDAVDLAVQHQLIFFDLSLQTFKMILERLDCLNKAIGPSDIEQTGAQFSLLRGHGGSAGTIMFQRGHMTFSGKCKVGGLTPVLEATAHHVLTGKLCWSGHPNEMHQ
ncbi:hypothetical protein C0995_016159 [Termitomyces sp. Mi166|nr:hypothetical protein C0995_016159 [Termitomyces sp. Mi166\